MILLSHWRANMKNHPINFSWFSNFEGQPKKVSNVAVWKKMNSIIIVITFHFDEILFLPLLSEDWLWVPLGLFHQHNHQGDWIEHSQQLNPATFWVDFISITSNNLSFESEITKIFARVFCTSDFFKQKRDLQWSLH